MMRLLLVSFLAGMSMVGQTAITTSASRSLNVTPDQVNLSISVSADLARTQDEVIAALAGVGVIAENLTGISTGSGGTIFDPSGNPPPPGPVTLRYSFQVLIAIERWKDALANVEALAKKLPEGMNSLQYNSSLSASVTVIEKARQSVLGDLLTEARKNADALAGAAGFKTGVIQGLSETHYVNGNQVTITISVRFAKV